MTGREMCEFIADADFLRKKDGTSPSPLEIWESGAGGDLSRVFEWYEAAKTIKRMREEEM